VGEFESCAATLSALLERLGTRRLLGAAGAVIFVGGLVALGAWAAYSWWESRLPGQYNVMDLGVVEAGGGPAPGEHAAHRGVSIARLEGPTGKPDVRFTLTAKKASVRLSSGRTVDALTFDGRLPGPELRMRRGDLVEVTLVNEDVEDGVSIHWHGVDVPNAEDGVAGVTQDAVEPGDRYTYRFRPDQAGTFWYHTHQVSADNVARGLYGPLVILPERSEASGFDFTAVVHNFSGVDALNRSDVPARRAVPAGTNVRVRLVNSDSFTRRFVLSGTPFRVAAIDGVDVNAPTPISGQRLELGAGGRYDVVFTMPSKPVRLGLVDSPVALTFSRGGSVDLPPVSFDRSFDPASYGRPTPVPTRFDRSFDLDIDSKLGFFDGAFGYQWTVNGGIFPDTPVYSVRRDDSVKIRIANESGDVHPMHLHGHHVRVLTRDGVPVRGSPWWVDTLNVRDGEEYEVAFRADNPGVWMFHCHILDHAAAGLNMHLAYDGYRTPFEVGGDADNDPE
jgi:FtsP/CotA-like multicopper oxidase with cupredoxin domain